MRMLIGAALAGAALLAAFVLLVTREPGGVPPQPGTVQAEAMPQQPSEPEAEPAAERQEIERIVRDYILANPQIVEEALILLEAQRREEQAAQQRAAVAELSQKIFESPHQATFGNLEGEVTLVEFFDYNCGYCRRALNDALALMETNPDLRLVMKEFPILSQGSLEAARISVAVSNLAPEAYLDFHRDMFERPGEADRQKALAVARGLGLDAAALEAAAAGAEVDEALAEVQSLAMALGINGTPSYVVGGETVFGAVGLERLQAKIDEARKCGDGVASC